MQTNFPCLETQRLILRALASEDTDFIYRHFSDPAVSRYLMDEAPLEDVAGAREIVQFYLEPSAATYNRWVMVLKSDPQPIGTCGFHKWSRRNFRAEIGYDLSPAYWGQGYMLEAMRAAVAYGFDHMDLNRIEALVYVGNDRSIRLLEKLGFVQEGLLRDYYYSEGKFHDHCLFALARRDWGTQSQGS